MSHWAVYNYKFALAFGVQCDSMSALGLMDHPSMDNSCSCLRETSLSSVSSAIGRLTFQNYLRPSLRLSFLMNTEQSSTVSASACIAARHILQAYFSNATSTHHPLYLNLSV